MAWRDFYVEKNVTKTLPELKESTVAAEVILGTIEPVIMPPIEDIIAPEAAVAPTTGLMTESGAACRVEGSAMPPPRITDGARLCSKVHKFLG